MMLEDVYKRQAETPFITSVAAAAVLDSVLKVGAAAEVKWPNDILCHGKKVCGILTEMSSDPEQTYYIIVGIGINLYNESFPDEIDVYKRQSRYGFR